MTHLTNSFSFITSLFSPQFAEMAKCPLDSKTDSERELAWRKSNRRVDDELEGVVVVRLKTRTLEADRRLFGMVHYFLPCRDAANVV